MAKASLTVTIYNAPMVKTLLRGIRALLPVLGPRLVLWLANQTIRWLLWYRIGGRWWRAKRFRVEEWD